MLPQPFQARRLGSGSWPPGRDRGAAPSRRTRARPLGRGAGAGGCAGRGRAAPGVPSPAPLTSAPDSRELLTWLSPSVGEAWGCPGWSAPSCSPPAAAVAAPRVRCVCMCVCRGWGGGRGPTRVPQGPDVGSWGECLRRSRSVPEIRAGSKVEALHPGGRF